jgi:bifunctional non-homologous end joining protein LigD
MNDGVRWGLFSVFQHTPILREMDWRAPRRPAVLPAGFIEPCNPTVAKKAPSGPQWIHEIKHDGYRLIVRKQEARVRVFTRRGFDWSYKFPAIVEALKSLRATSITIDGEAVYCTEDGVSNFDKLHSQAHNDSVFLYAFDLLECNGVDWRPEPLAKRKAKLQKVVANAKWGMRLTEHCEGDGAIVFEHACKFGLEGIVSKRRDLGYVSGRSKAWLKIKNPTSPAMLRLEEHGAW